MDLRLHYKGFIGSVEKDNRTKMLSGKILNVDHLIFYQADNIQDLDKEFKKAVKYYKQILEDKRIEEKLNND